MKLTISIFLFFLLQFLLSCSQPSNNQLTGKWNLLPGKESAYEFNDNYDFSLKAHQEILMKGKYIQKGNNSLYLYNYTDSKVDSVPIRLIYKIEGNLLYLCNFKNANNNIKDHIDEVAIFEKMNPTKALSTMPIKDTTKTQIIIIEGDLIGNYGINYQQSDVSQEAGNHHNKTIHISKNRLAVTNINAEPFEYIKNNFIFMNKNHKVIPSFIMNNYQRDLNKLLSGGFCKDSVYVCLYGYNQAARDDLNSYFKTNIFGQVLMFRVDTLKNFLYKSEYSVFPLGVR